MWQNNLEKYKIQFFLNKKNKNMSECVFGNNFNVIRKSSFFTS